MFQKALARFLTAPDSPTVDLYFMNACGDFLLGGLPGESLPGGRLSGGGLRQLGPTVFAGPGSCLVMRHDLRAGRGARIPAGGRLLYFVDDAVEQGPEDASLPFLYRQKLRLVERAVSRRVLPRAAVVVVSSAALARLYGGAAETHVLHPYWSEPVAGQEHFARMPGGDAWLDIAYLGSAVHRADLAFLWPVIGDVLRRHPRVRFHLSERHRVPRALAGHPRIVPIPGRGWSIYRAALKGRRFHLALYPLMDTPYNRGRSINKLIEHGVVGAAAIYSRGWPEARRVEAAGAGLVVGNRPQEWHEAIEALLARPARMLALAKAAGALARSLNQPGPQRRLWAQLMQVELDAAA